MKSLFSSTVILLLLVVPSFAQSKANTEPDAVQKTVWDFFQALADNDETLLKNTSTFNLQILEDGALFTLDSMVSFLQKPRPTDFKRINHLTFLRTEIKGDAAYVSYWNEAEVKANGNDWSIKWLESAVLLKDKGQWKIDLLHSTLVKRTKK